MPNPPIQYAKGSLVRLSYQCVDINSAPIDPGDLTIRVKNPLGETTVYVYGTDEEVVRLNTGLFKIDISLNESGLWHHRAEVVGLGQSAVERSLFVQQSNFSD